MVWDGRSTGRLTQSDGVNVRAVRGWVCSEVERLGASGVDLGDVALMVDEIATNALKHTRSGSPGGGVWASVSSAPDRIRVSVTDDGGADSLPEAKSAGSWEECGRGLALVAALSDDWGFERLPGHRRCVLVWFEVVRQPGAAVTQTATTERMK
jgi:anti-sigma regulatory factor (Ser/Thr protein kinase)